MRILTFLVCLGAAPLFGQNPVPMPPFPIFPPELQKYLDLSNTQVDAIRRANTDLDVYRARKQMRIAQVQREIQEWTAADPIDAMQLGVRYAELEGINREIRDQEKKTTATVRGVLNPAQTAKLKVLEDAVKLQPLINEAVCENLMVGAGAPLPTSIMRVSDAASLAGMITGSTFGCARPVVAFLPQP